MSAFSARAATLLLLLAGAGCGGSHPIDPPPDDDPVLTTVEVTPGIATIFTLRPVNRVRLAATGKDQDGVVMTDLPDPGFTSDNEAVATVDAGGVVTAIAPGTARINASLTVQGSTKTGGAEITVIVPPETAEVGAPQFAFQPQAVDVAAGGEVTWNIGEVHHTVNFTTLGAPTDIPELQNQSADRSFPSAGSFEYHCDIHPGMTGTVRVH